MQQYLALYDAAGQLDARTKAAMALEIGFNRTVGELLLLAASAETCRHACVLGMNCRLALCPLCNCCSAAARVTPVQKTRIVGLSAPLHPDIVSITREGLNYFGLLPPEMAMLCSGPPAAAQRQLPAAS